MVPHAHKPDDPDPELLRSPNPSEDEALRNEVTAALLERYWKAFGLVERQRQIEEAHFVLLDAKYNSMPRRRAASRARLMSDRESCRRLRTMYREEVWNVAALLIKLGVSPEEIDERRTQITLALADKTT